MFWVCPALGWYWARAARVLVYRWNNSLQHCSTAVGGGATIRGGKLQWWAGVGCSVRHGALFRDEIMGWPGPGSRVWVAATVPTPAPVSVSCTVTRVSAPTTYNIH